MSNATIILMAFALCGVTIIVLEAVAFFRRLAAHRRRERQRLANYRADLADLNQLHSAGQFGGDSWDT